MKKLIRSITSSFHYFIMVQRHNTGIFWKLVCSCHPPLRYDIHVWISPYPLSIIVFVTAQLIPVSLSVCCGLWDLKRFQYCSLGFDLHLSLGVRWTNVWDDTLHKPKASFRNLGMNLLYSWPVFRSGYGSPHNSNIWEYHLNHTRNYVYIHFGSGRLRMPQKRSPLWTRWANGEWKICLSFWNVSSTVNFIAYIY